LLPNDLAKDLVAARLRSLDDPPSLAARARLTQHVLEALAVALARHLDETERGYAHDLRLRMIAREPRRQRLQHLMAMLLLDHVDEVDDDDAAEVAQPKLARDHARRLEVGSEDRLLEVAMADVRAGIDVDRRHRLGLIEHDMAAGLQRHLAVQRAVDLVLDAVQIE